MTDRYDDNQEDKLSSQARQTEKENRDFRYYYAVEDLPNEKVPNCYTCKKQGYPHEAITIEKVKDRPLSDGTTKVLGYKIKDYFTDRPHKHKQQPQQEGRYYMGWDLEVFD